MIKYILCESLPLDREYKENTIRINSTPDLIQCKTENKVLEVF